MIATKHTAEPPDADAALLVDVDLAILGAGRGGIRPLRKSGARGILVSFRKSLFRAKRREILQAFLARPSLYRTPALHHRFEPSARENLARAIADLA